MKATLSVLAMLVAMSSPALAQNIQYDEATNTVVETKASQSPVIVSAPVAAAPAAPVVVAAPAPVVVAAPSALTPNTASSSQQTTVTVVTPTAQSLGIQEQPATVIEDQPLKDSRADLLHKARGQMENHTETKIVEKLEEARIRDEKKRSDRFDQAIDTSEQPAPVLVPVVPVSLAPAPAPAAPEVITPVAPVVIAPGAQAQIKEEVKVEKKEEDVKIESNDDVRPVVRQEIRADIEARAPERKEDKTDFYIGALGGISDYPSANNIKANGTGGFDVGIITKNRIIVEGGFSYSSFDLQENNYLYGNSQYPPYKDLKQYNMTLALKYQILPGAFRPYGGVVIGYTQRTYSTPNNTYSYPYGYAQNNQDATSNAIDVGLTAGIDVAVTSNLLIGFDFRYMTNMSNHSDSAYQQSVSNSGYSVTTPVEELDYYTAAASIKLLF